MESAISLYNLPFILKQNKFIRSGNCCKIPRKLQSRRRMKLSLHQTTIRVTECVEQSEGVKILHWSDRKWQYLDQTDRKKQGVHNDS